MFEKMLSPMKLTATLLIAALSSGAAFAQTFSSPESVEHDAAYNRWIVGENGANRVDTYSPGSGTLTSFGTTITSGPHGIEVLGNVAYACDGGVIRGYDLSNGNEVFNVNLGATFLNGLTSDGGHFLFTTDFTAKKIYRVNTLTSSYNLMTTTAKTPNGIIYDGANNRCVFVTWGSNAPIQAMSLADSTISTLLTTTLSNCDGITRDQAGYWYVTSWGTNALNRVPPAFSSAPTSVMTGLSSPADISINAAGDSIGIPNSGSTNNVVFYTGITTGITQHVQDLRPMSCSPNPASGPVTVTLSSEVNNASLVLFDITGKLLEKQHVNGKTFTVSRGDRPDGFYFIALYDAKEKMIAVQKVAFVKN